MVDTRACTCSSGMCMPLRIHVLARYPATLNVISKQKSRPMVIHTYTASQLYVPKISYLALSNYASMCIYSTLLLPPTSRDPSPASCLLLPVALLPALSCAEDPSPWQLSCAVLQVQQKDSPHPPRRETGGHWRRGSTW